MKRFIILSIVFIALNTHLIGTVLPLLDEAGLHVVTTDSLPLVLTNNHGDLVESKLRLEAILKFGEHQLPDNLEEWGRIIRRLPAVKEPCGKEEFVFLL